MAGSSLFLSGLVAALLLAGCSEEARTVAADLPQSAPNGSDDPRAAKYERNLYQVAQGGRYFAWYGCGGCHGADAKGALDLADQVWRHGGAVNQIFASIAERHRAGPARLDARIPAEQLWQITGFVRSLPRLSPEKRRRQELDLAGEPQASRWAGPVQ